MLQRLFTALSLAGLTFLATAGVSQAALDWDRDEVMITTGIVVIALMALLFVFYLIKRALGVIDRMPPPEPDTSDHGHH